jgi:hypothetical protein
MASIRYTYDSGKQTDVAGSLTGAIREEPTLREPRAHEKTLSEGPERAFLVIFQEYRIARWSQKICGGEP